MPKKILDEMSLIHVKPSQVEIRLHQMTVILIHIVIL